MTPIDDLRKTDITEHALNALSESKIQELYLVGRRGPLQVAFTIKELREQLKMTNCKTIWRKEDFIGVSEVIPNLERPRKRLTELMLKSLNECGTENAAKKFFRPIFYRSPNKFIINKNKKLSGVELTVNKMEGEKCVATDKKEILECQLVFRSIGYKSIKVDSGLNFDAQNGIVKNDKGRIVNNAEDKLAKLYVAGWLGTGPAGVILHTMGHAFQVAKIICEDLKKDSNETPGFEGIKKYIIEKNIQIVDWQGWERIDKYEIEEGKKLGKPREKVCDLTKMLQIAHC